MTTTHETGVIQLANVGVPGAAVYPAGGVSKYTFSVVRPLFVCMDQEPGTATPFSFRANNRAFLRPSDAF